MARTEDQRFSVSDSMTIGFIGAGRMAQAMSRGFISKGKQCQRGSHSNGTSCDKYCIIMQVPVALHNMDYADYMNVK